MLADILPRVCQNVTDASNAIYRGGLQWNSRGGFGTSDGEKLAYFCLPPSGSQNSAGSSPSTSSTMSRSCAQLMVMNSMDAMMLSDDVD